MADIKIHRKKGFNFGDVYVDSKREDDGSGIYLIDVKSDATPDMTYFEFNVPGRNGSNYYDNKYEDKDITVTVGIYAPNIAKRRLIQREFLNGIVRTRKAKLTFLDEPSFYYLAELFDSIGESEKEILTELSIPFKCSYCKYGEDKSYNLVSGSTYISNAGNFDADTIFEITATANGNVTIASNINSFTLTGLVSGETVFIDSKQMIVYKIENNIKVSAMTRFTGKFIKIKPEGNTITLTGNATVKLTYSDTYIV